MAQMITAPDESVVAPRCHIYCSGKRMVESCTVEGCGKLLVDGKPSCEHGIGLYYYGLADCAYSAESGSPVSEGARPRRDTRLRLVGG